MRRFFNFVNESTIGKKMVGETDEEAAKARKQAHKAAEAKWGKIIDDIHQAKVERTKPYWAIGPAKSNRKH
jgi:hypothetical protein